MSKLTEYLNRYIAGNVFDRPEICSAYARDRSPLEITPKLVALPKNSEDVRRLLRFINQLAARNLQLPITFRGTGLDKTGAAIGPGAVISFEKMCALEEIDTRGRLVRVQPGMTVGELNEILRHYGLRLPIEADPRSTIGGLIATNPNDEVAARFGGIYHFVEAVEAVLPSGDLVQFSPYSSHAVHSKVASHSAEGILYDHIEDILDERADTILDRSVRPYDTAGYANITKVREGHSTNLLPLLFASQGTLAAITDVILKVEPLPPFTKRLLISFHDLKIAQRFLNFASDLEPYMLKVFDLRILDEAAEDGKKLDLFTRKFGKGLLVLIGFDFRRNKSMKRLRRCLEVLPSNILRIEEVDDNRQAFSEIENLLLCFLNRGNGQRAPILDDVYVPSVHFGEFLDGLKELERVMKMDLPLYGSFLTSSYSIRPDFDPTDLRDRQRIVEFMQIYGELVEACSGSITGNAPEGRTKILAYAPHFEKNEEQLYQEIKSAFDPNHILNPGVKLGAKTRDAMRYLCTREKDGVITP